MLPAQLCPQHPAQDLVCSKINKYLWNPSLCWPPMFAQQDSWRPSHEARLLWCSCGWLHPPVPSPPLPLPRVTLHSCCPKLVIQAFQPFAELWPFGGRAVSQGGLAPSSVPERLNWLQLSSWGWSEGSAWGYFPAYGSSGILFSKAPPALGAAHSLF